MSDTYDEMYKKFDKYINKIDADCSIPLLVFVRI